MDNINRKEKLLLKIIHLLSQKYKNKAILKGGMLLRLLNSPRHTQDVDYIFVDIDSRKIVAQEINKLLLKEKIQVKNTQLNSRGIIMEACEEDITALIEISVKDKPYATPEQKSTFVLANSFQLPAHVITVMSPAEAFAHKISACLERDSLRDFYDLSLFEPLTSFDKKTLKARLTCLAINRRKPISITFKAAAKLLSEKTHKLTQDKLERELFGLIPEAFFQGGIDIIKSSVFRICQNLENT
ncbi:nucleotidyl transferase AbiEii/AbiGii toxin family protein [bacterium]|nr:nucleotidyl transferase AbiEii/AbiGii toxin family protein [bacterium]